MAQLIRLGQRLPQLAERPAVDDGEIALQDLAGSHVGQQLAWRGSGRQRVFTRMQFASHAHLLGQQRANTTHWRGSRRAGCSSQQCSRNCCRGRHPCCRPARSPFNGVLLKRLKSCQPHASAPSSANPHTSSNARQATRPRICGFSAPCLMSHPPRKIPARANAVAGGGPSAPGTYCTIAMDRTGTMPRTLELRKISLARGSASMA